VLSDIVTVAVFAFDGVACLCSYKMSLIPRLASLGLFWVNQAERLRRLVVHPDQVRVVESDTCLEVGTAVSFDSLGRVYRRECWCRMKNQQNDADIVVPNSARIDGKMRLILSH